MVSVADMSYEAAGMLKGWLPTLLARVSNEIMGCKNADGGGTRNSSTTPTSNLPLVSHFWSDEGATESERGFDIADAMECGMARELVTDYVQPLRRSRTLWRFKVVRSEDRLDYRLYSDDPNLGEAFLMYARCRVDSNTTDFYLYDPVRDNSGLFDSSRPAFSMTWNAAGTEWRLLQHRPTSVEVAVIRQTSRNVGHGVNHCMDVVLPAPEGSKSSKDIVLASKLPEWNEDVGSLVLDFRGRRISASAKNFQLAPVDRRDYVTCQFGKLTADSFALDFRYPLTVIQAFGIALSTVHWA